MTERIASLAMYDADRAAAQAWWSVIARELRGAGVDGVPAWLDWPADLAAHWRDPRLLLGQMCGYPLVTAFLEAVQVVGAFRYTAAGCSGIFYRSELIARVESGTGIESFRGQVAAINSPDSHSGSNALRGLVAPLAVDGSFFGRWHVCGSHRQSLRALRSGLADIAAIDCVSLAAIRRCEPDAMAGLRVLGSTAAAPGLPLVTSATTTPEELATLQGALAAACRDPMAVAVREALFIGGFEIVPASAWQVVEDVRVNANEALWRG